MSGSCTSSRTRSGFSSFTACRAAAPVSASPTISYPSASRSVRALARKLGWSSTMSTVMPTASSFRPAFRIRLATLFEDGRPGKACAAFLRRRRVDASLGASSSPFGSLLIHQRLGSCRNLHMEDRAAPAVGLDPDSPVHAADELAGDVEAQAGAPDSPGHVWIDPVELLEDAALLGRRYAEPLVGDGEAYVLARGFKAHAYVSAVRRVLDRVVDQVGQDLPKLAFVCGDPRNVLLSGIETDPHA